MELAQDVKEISGTNQDPPPKAAPPKVISLSVRALQASHLCFEVGGILEEVSVNLGEEISQSPPGKFLAFDFAGFYETLATSPSGKDPSLLVYNPTQIQTSTQTAALAWLRAEGVKTALNKAIMARQNAYFAKYQNAPAIATRMIQYYSDDSTLNPYWQESKPYRLAQLGAISSNQWGILQDAYNNDKITGVVRHTRSKLESDTTSYGYSGASGKTDQFSYSFDGWFSTWAKVDAPEPPDPWKKPSQWPPPAPEPPTPVSKSPLGAWVWWNSPNGLPEPAAAGIQSISSYQVVSSQDKAHQDQWITNTGYTYRVPGSEGEAQYQRAQISLMDQQFAQFMYGQNLPNLTTVFQNELNSIDADVYRLQIAYLNTILMSPIAGTVTGVYKRQGEAVRAGEPVIRVESNAVLLLVATLVYRSPIRIGWTMTVKTTLFDSPTLPVTISGKIVAVRGRQQDDHWEVIAQCNNLDDTGNPILPFGYHFDYDDTTVSISDIIPVV